MTIFGWTVAADTDLKTYQMFDIVYILVHLLSDFL
jgi:hypothetical protein